MNKVKKLFIFLINKPLYMKFLLVLMFVLYGAIISTISYSISNYYQVQNTKEKLIKTQKQSFKVKSNNLKNKMNSFNYSLESLKNSRTFLNFVTKQNNKKELEDIFLLIMQSKKDISQLRYLDENGQEKIRFDRESIANKPYLLHKKQLQNKASRYYFKEIKNTKNNTIWYSKLDLNIEHGVIQKPIVPTLRIGTPIYINKEFKGIVMMNIFFKNIILDFIDSSFFYISVFDKDGEFIYNKIHIDSKYIDNSWSRYIKNEQNYERYKEYKKILMKDENIKEYIFSESISSIIPNTDELSVEFNPKVLKLKEVHDSDANYILSVTVFVLLISIPLALVISILPNMINRELFDTKKILEEEAEVIDEYVYLTVANKDGIILDVSQAYTELTGYAKEELVGKKHSLLRHPDTTLETYEDLWHTILSKKVWKGELKNLKKDGNEFNAEILIKPSLDEEGEIKNFTAYVQDTTYQKQVEKKSVTDELTELYNRREFNTIFKRDVAHSKRFDNPFSMMILDIDYFKQYNDTYGHLQGDEALKEVAQEIRNCCKRSTDIAFRIGGEEFCLIFSSSTKTDAYNFANSIKKSISNLKIEHKSSKVSKHISVSIGLFFQKKIKNLDENDIYKRCDEALYQAKNEGRNKVVFFQT